MTDNNLSILAVFLAFVSGALIAVTVMTKYWQDESVKQGVAEYDTETGVWQWKAKR